MSLVQMKLAHSVMPAPSMAARYRLACVIVHEVMNPPALQPKDREAIGVCPALRDRKVGCALDITVGPVAEVFVNRVQERRPVADRAAILRLHDDIAEASDDAREGVECERVVGFGPAMWKHEKRIALTER